MKKHAWISLGILSVGLVLFLNLLAASPLVHEWFHADAGKVEHHCAVTLFAHGQVDVSGVDVSVPAPLVFAVALPKVEFSVFTPTIKNLPAGRAPPVASVNS